MCYFVGSTCLFYSRAVSWQCILNNDVFVDWDWFREDRGPDALAGIVLQIISQEENAYGEMILIVRHIETGKELRKEIRIYKSSDNDTGNDGSTTPEPTPEPIPVPNPVPGGGNSSPGFGPSFGPVEEPSFPVQPDEEQSQKPEKPEEPEDIAEDKLPSVELSHTNVTLYTNGSGGFKLDAFVTGYSKKVKFTSSEPSIATVDKEGNIVPVSKGTVVITVEVDGVIKAMKPGTTTITVKCSGVTKEVQVTVKEVKNSFTV